MDNLLVILLILSQFALAAGSTVIATTSSDIKAERLRSLGAHHVINYCTNPGWGETAKSLTRGGKGIDIVVDVGGLSTLPQSFKAVRTDGLIAVTGMLGKPEDQAAVPSMMDCLMNVCTARGLLLGTRDQFNEMNKFITDKGIKPIVDDKVFEFKDAKEAYRYLEQQKHFSKVCIRLE
jgi:NADPH:quinone reductase-like Zn-dependent oxidoreductase